MLGMEIVSISFNAIAPLFLFMALGFFLKKADILHSNGVDDINKLVFKVLLPVNIAVAIYKADLRAEMDMRMLLLAVGTIIVSFLISWLSCLAFEKDRALTATMVQGMFKCNYVITGIPVILSVYGRLGIAAVLVPFVTITNNVLSVFIFEYYGSTGKKIGKMLINMAKNPLILGSIAGLVLNLSNLTLPDSIYSGFLTGLSNSTTPVAMIALGASFHFDSLKKNARLLVFINAMRLVVLPSFFLVFAVLIGLRGLDLGLIALIVATPNAVNSYSTAVAMGGNADLADEIVITTSLVSMLTMFVTFCIIGATVGF